MATSDSASKPRIGFLGMGQMGSRMARRILDAGYPLTVWDRNPDHSQPLADAGAKAARTARDVAKACDVLCSCVTDDRAVLDLYLGGSDAAIGGVHEGQTVIELSTILPVTAQHLAERLQASNASLLDVGVSGSTPQAEAGELVVLAGGPKDIFQRYKPILEVIGKSVTLVGDTGCGKMMKLVVNVLLGTQMQAMGEAIALGVKAGLDKKCVLDVLAQTAVLGPAHKSKVENARREQYPSKFGLGLMSKDFNLIFRRAMELSVPMPVSAAAQQAFTQACAHKQADEDFSVVIREAEQAAGLPANAVAS